MRCTTLKAAGQSVARLLDYYVGLAEDRTRPDQPTRGAVDYYLDPDEPAGRWWGDGVPALSVGEEVVGDDLREVLDGRHPTTGRSLSRRFGDRSARGFDCTFSAPKSVSVLWALSPDPWVRAEVLASHEAAVDAALGWFQQHGAITRRGKDGVDQVDTRGIAAALFRQHTSRSIDPQLHTHAVISAKVQDPTGRWLSLDARFLKQQQRTIGWIYDAALRTELSNRLGVTWRRQPVGRIMDLDVIPETLCRLFSERSTQVAAKHAELITRWTREHDGQEPDARTIAQLERTAVLASRPAKEARLDADSLREGWTDIGRDQGLDPAALTATRLRSRHTHRPHSDHQLIDTALEMAQQEAAAWHRADLVRHLTTLVTPTRALSADALVEQLDHLADLAAERCIDLGPARGGPCRKDGRPIEEAVTDRLLSTPKIIGQEERLQEWARTRTQAPPVAARDPQTAAVDAIAGRQRLTLIVGPAGTGKTTTTAAAVALLIEQRRPVIGLAPSGKAADVLSERTRMSTHTVAHFLAHQHGHHLAPGTTIVLDEAGMVSTDDLEKLTVIADRSFTRIVMIGDPAQLPSVARGGVFAHWCDTLPHVALDTPRRFTEPWEADASLRLRSGDPAAAEIYDRQGRLRTAHPALLAQHVADLHEARRSRDQSVAITTRTADTARSINIAIQRRTPPGPQVELHDGTTARPGDKVATRRNDHALATPNGQSVRNRHVWTVRDVHTDGSLTVAHPARGSVRLPTAYVAEHVELGWAVTGYGNQGDTVDAGLAVIEPGTTRANAYVALTRGRRSNLAVIPDPTGLTEPADALAAVIARAPNRSSALSTRSRLHAEAGLDRPSDPPAVEIRRPSRPTPGMGRDR